MNDKLTEWEKCLLWTTNGDVSHVDAFMSDIERVRDSIMRVRGEPTTMLEAAIFWDWVSDDYCAGFLDVPKGDELDKQVKRYIDKLMGSDDQA